MWQLIIWRAHLVSNSMKGDKADNFQKGDLLKIKILDEEEKKNLQPGDVITFCH